MAFDSLQIAASLALFAAGVGAWILAALLKVHARLYLRFAAVLFAALAAASLLHLGDVAALLLLPLAASALAICAVARYARPLNSFAASAVLVTGLAGGLGAILSSLVMLALVPVMLLGLAIIAAALNRVAILAALSGAALLAAGLCLAGQGAGAGVMLFCAAALIGLSRTADSALAVQQQSHSWRLGARGARQAAAIGRFHRDAALATLGKGLPQDLRHK